MTAKEVILEQLKATYNQKNWFVPFCDSVAGLTAEQAAMKDSSGNHSVWGIVNHLIFWNGRWLTRLNGGEPEKMEIDNNATFIEDGTDDEKWQLSVKKLDEISSAIIDKIQSSDDTFLSSEAFPGYNASWYEMLTQMTIHNAYHIGQIVHLRKQYGNWNPAIGVGA